MIHESHLSLVGLLAPWNFIYIIGCLMNSSPLLHLGKFVNVKVIWLFIFISMEAIIFPAVYALIESRSPHVRLLGNTRIEM